MSDETQNSGMSDATFKRLKGLLSEPDPEDIGVGSEPLDEGGTSEYVSSKKINKYFRGTKDELAHAVLSLDSSQMEKLYLDELKTFLGAANVSTAKLEGETIFLLNDEGQKHLSANVFVAVNMLSESNIRTRVVGDDPAGATGFLASQGSLIISPDVDGVVELFQKNHPEQMLSEKEAKNFKAPRQASHRFKALLEKITKTGWEHGKIKPQLVDDAFADVDVLLSAGSAPKTAASPAIFQPEYTTTQAYKNSDKLAASLVRALGAKNVVVNVEEGHIKVHFCSDNVKAPSEMASMQLEKEFAENQIRQR